MNPVASAFAKLFRLLSNGPFPRQLAEGISQPSWSWRAAALAVLVWFGGFSLVEKIFSRYGAVWPAALIAHVPMLCALGYLTRLAGTTVERVFGLGKVRVGAVLVSSILLCILELISAVGSGVTLSWLGFGAGTGEHPEPARETSLSFFAFTDRVVWAPICEELACRGLLYTSLRTRLGIVTSSVLTAAVFAWLHHPSSLLAAGCRFFPAVVYSLWYERTRSLWPNVIAHAVHNLVGALK